jgi:hypothetical protein
MPRACKNLLGLLPQVVLAKHTIGVSMWKLDFEVDQTTGNIVVVSNCCTLCRPSELQPPYTSSIPSVCARSHWQNGTMILHAAVGVVCDVVDLV